MTPTTVYFTETEKERLADLMWASQLPCQYDGTPSDEDDYDEGAGEPSDDVAFTIFADEARDAFTIMKTSSGFQAFTHRGVGLAARGKSLGDVLPAAYAWASQIHSSEGQPSSELQQV